MALNDIGKALGKIVGAKLAPATNGKQNSATPQPIYDVSMPAGVKPIQQKVDQEYDKITSYTPETALKAYELGDINGELAGTLTNKKEANEEAKASADALIGLPGTDSKNSVPNIVTAYAPDAQVTDKDFWDAYNAYKGNKGTSAYDWLTNPAYYEDWYTYINDPVMSKYYEDDTAKFGDLSDRNNFDKYWNQYNDIDFGSLYNSSSAEDVALLNQILGTDANVRTAINTGLYDSGLAAPAAGIDAEGNYLTAGTTSRDDAIAAMDYGLMMQAMQGYADNPEALQSVYDINDMNYLNRYTGTVYSPFNPKNNAAELIQPDQMTGMYAGGTAYITPSTIDTTDSLVNQIYGLDYALPSESTYTLGTQGVQGASDRWNDYLTEVISNGEYQFYNADAAPEAEGRKAQNPLTNQGMLLAATPEIYKLPVNDLADTDNSGFVSGYEADAYNRAVSGLGNNRTGVGQIKNWVYNKR